MNVFGYDKYPAHRQQCPVDSNNTGNDLKGMISEVVYSEDQPWVTQMVLLPLLKQLGQQSRWQLWLTPQQKLSRTWVETTGLPLAKIMQVRQMTPKSTLQAMAYALRTGNYSVVIGWQLQELADEEQKILTEAAETGKAIGFIMRPVRNLTHSHGPLSGLKIHSTLYH